MDIINPDLFEFDGGMSVNEIVNVWKERGAWFFDVVEQERVYYTLCENNNSMVLDDNKKVLQFKNVKNAFEHIQKHNLQDIEVITQTYHYFVAKDDKGRFIMTTNGEVREFGNEEKALNAALNYNDDLVKMRLAVEYVYPRPVFID